eukprot:5791266-Prymnesium_polylepis.1
MDIHDSPLRAVWPDTIAGKFVEGQPRRRELMWASREEERESAPIMLQFGVDCDPSNQDHRAR